MRERVNPKFIDAVRRDQGTGLPLFDSAARRTAPPETVRVSETRRASYHKLLAQPERLNALQQRILGCVREHGPISSRGIEQITKIPRHVVTARIVELRDGLGLIVRREEKMLDAETNRMVEVYLVKAQ